MGAAGFDAWTGAVRCDDRCGRLHAMRRGGIGGETSARLALWALRRGRTSEEAALYRILVLSRNVAVRPAARHNRVLAGVKKRFWVESSSKSLDTPAHHPEARLPNYHLKPRLRRVSRGDHVPSREEPRQHRPSPLPPPVVQLRLLGPYGLLVRLALAVPHLLGDSKQHAPHRVQHRAYHEIEQRRRHVRQLRVHVHLNRHQDLIAR